MSSFNDPIDMHEGWSSIFYLFFFQHYFLLFFCFFGAGGGVRGGILRYLTSQKAPARHMLTSALLCVWKGGSDASRFDVGVALFACYSKRKKKKERKKCLHFVPCRFFGRFGAAKAKSEIGRAAQHDAISKVRQRSPPKGGNENKKKGPKRKSFGG